MALRALRREDPATLGPYVLQGRLGAGGMGVVHLAFGPDDVPVAVKTLPPGADESARARMHREAQMLATVKSRRVAAYVADDMAAQTPWLALEYVPGPNVAEAAVPLDEPVLRLLASGLAEALASLHEAGITHRDIKPANVVLTYEGPVLVDFGIARSVELPALTSAGTVIGSPAWMSPEQLRGEPAGPAADVWGWGAVLTYAATGLSPFGEGAVEAMAYRIAHTEPSLAGLPDWLRSPVAAALSKEPSARPASERLLARANNPVLLAGTAQLTRHAAPPQNDGEPTQGRPAAVRWAHSRRMEVWFGELAEAFDELRARVPGLDAEALAGNDRFVDAVVLATRAAEGTHQREKVAALRNAVLNAALVTAPEPDLQRAFFRQLDEFSPSHLRLLAFLDDPAGFYDCRGLPRDVGAGTRATLLERAVPGFSGRRDVYDPLMNDLARAGLATGELHELLADVERWRPATTARGQRFLEFIADPPVLR